jgi:hypothetical protein
MPIDGATSNGAVTSTSSSSSSSNRDDQGGFSNQGPVAAPRTGSYTYRGRFAGPHPAAAAAGAGSYCSICPCCGRDGWSGPAAAVNGHCVGDGQAGRQQMVEWWRPQQREVPEWWRRQQQQQGRAVWDAFGSAGTAAVAPPPPPSKPCAAAAGHTQAGVTDKPQQQQPQQQEPVDQLTCVVC